jgi:acetyl-CoA carboxylase biotin carboxyl carrier protein
MASKKKSTVSASSEPDWAGVERALKVMERYGLEEFEYSDGAFHVRLKKPSASVPAAANPLPAAAAPAAEAAPQATASAPAAAPQTAPPAAEAEAGEKVHIVKSPIVGTYYSASSPGAPVFVRVGDHVNSGQVLCIIEAMKLMNEIESDVAGEVARIFVENGQPVEYGEPLFAIRPSGAARPA